MNVALPSIGRDLHGGVSWLQWVVDVYTVVRQGLIVGTPSYSLKDVERLYLPKRVGAVKTAGGLSIVVDNGEGCSVDALVNSHLLVRSATEALDLLLDPQHCSTTLRY